MVRRILAIHEVRIFIGSSGPVIVSSAGKRRKLEGGKNPAFELPQRLATYDAMTDPVEPAHKVPALEWGQSSVESERLHAT